MQVSDKIVVKTLRRRLSHKCGINPRLKYGCTFSASLSVEYFLYYENIQMFLP